MFFAYMASGQGLYDVYRWSDIRYLLSTGKSRYIAQAAPLICLHYMPVVKFFVLRFL